MNGETEKKLIGDVEYIRGKIDGICEEIKNARKERRNLSGRVTDNEVAIAIVHTKIEGIKTTAGKISGYVSAGVVVVFHAVKLFLRWDR